MIDFKKALKKINCIYKIFLLIIIFLSFVSLKGTAEESERIVNINVYPEISINENFYGFGAETLPWLWTKENREAGVGEADIRLNLERIKDMHLPITRIFVPWETWNPSTDYETFTWGSDEMKSLYKTLDVYQEMGTSVIIVTVDWLENCPWQNIEGSARAVLRLLEHLVQEKDYNCIRFWTLTNEPELTYFWLRKLPFKNYIQIHRLVKRGLREKGLPIRIIASDEVESQEWFERSVQFLYKTADVFSSHLYLYPEQIDRIPDFFRKRLKIIKTANLTNRHIPFFLCEFGFRGSDFSSCTNSLMQDYEYGLYVADLCVEVLNSGVGAACLWCLHQIRLIDEINPEGGKFMRIGLWAFKDRSWRPFPVFYLYRYFTKYIKQGSRVVEVRVSSNDQLKVACTEYQGQYSLFIVNMNKKSQPFIIRGLPKDLKMKRHIYIEALLTSSEQLMTGKTVEKGVKDYLKDEIPPQSVLLFTSLLGEFS